MRADELEQLADASAIVTPAVAPPPRSPGALDRRRLDRVLNYIEANLGNDITVADLAEIACLSLFHFIRAFDKAMGRTPHAYLSERRLNRAKQLLALSQIPLVDISLICRFSGQSNFTKAFKRAVGMSPGRYRGASLGGC